MSLPPHVNFAEQRPREIEKRTTRSHPDQPTEAAKTFTPGKGETKNIQEQKKPSLTRRAFNQIKEDFMLTMRVNYINVLIVIVISVPIVLKTLQNPDFQAMMEIIRARSEAEAGKFR